MKFSIIENQDGFTLVELIASLVLAGILAIALTTIIITAINGFFLSKDAADISQKSQLALTRIRTELINVTQITSAGQDKIVFDNDNGSYEIERASGIITLKKTGTNPVPVKTLTNDIETAYYIAGNKFLTYEKTGSVAWLTSDDISELYAITITIKFSSYNNVFQTIINPRSNTLRNAPKLVHLPFPSTLLRAVSLSNHGSHLATGRDASGIQKKSLNRNNSVHG